MAKKGDLAVGQVRELFNTRSTGRYTTPRMAKAKILALNQPVEISNRDSIYYDLHEDLVLVEILEDNGWATSTWSNRVFNERALTDQPEPAKFTTAYRKKWKHEELPKGQYLVKPIMLGEIWNEEEKQAEAEAKAIAEEQRRRYDAAVRHQDQQLSKKLSDAGISSSKWRGGHQWQLSSNDLATLINQLLQSEAVPLVHWADYQNMEVEL